MSEILGYIKQEPSVEYILYLPPQPEIINESTKQEIQTPIESKHHDVRLMHQCQICHKICISKFALKNHSKVHRERVECKICFKFFTVHTLPHHIKLHKTTGNYGKYQCPKCPRRFLTKQIIDKHLKVHTKPYECDFCGHRAALKGDIKTHVMIHLKNQIFECDICEKIYKSSRGLRKHKSAKHSDVNYQCDQCCYKTSIKFNLVNHLRTHFTFTGYKCNLCNKYLTTKTTLANHMFMHKDKKHRPFRCDQCDKSYTRIALLNEHKLSHNSNYRFRCDLCPKHYLKKKSLRNHLTVKHLSDAKILKCAYCKYETKYSGNFQQHQKSHSKSFECEICEKRFGFKCNLKRHLTTHNQD